jgi:hypothetical protein
LTTYSDPLARVRAMIDALDPDEPAKLDTFRHSFDTPKAQVSTPKAAETLGSGHFRHSRHPAAPEAIRSTSHHAPAAVDGGVHHTPAVVSTSNSVESVENALRPSESAGSIFDTGPAGVSKKCRKVSKCSGLDEEFPIVVVDDDDLPIAPCGWCGGRIFWQRGRRWIRDPTPLTDWRWRCRDCEPVTADIDMPNLQTLPCEDPTDRGRPYAPRRGEARATVFTIVRYEDGIMPVDFPLNLAAAVDALITGGKSVARIGRRLGIQDCEVTAIAEAMEGRRRNRDWPTTL